MIEPKSTNQEGLFAYLITRHGRFFVAKVISWLSLLWLVSWLIYTSSLTIGWKIAAFVFWIGCHIDWALTEVLCRIQDDVIKKRDDESGDTGS